MIEKELPQTNATAPYSDGLFFLGENKLSHNCEKPVF